MNKMKKNFSEIINQYTAKSALFADFTSQMNHLITELIANSNIRVHSVESRVKDRISLEKKILNPSKHYQNIDDITDICGIRIITYFEDEVDAIASIIKREFTIDQSNSTDKRASWILIDLAICHCIMWQVCLSNEDN